ncbi:MAG: S-methyl-5-thioribose-1-phosphate isomerase [Gammaproteobacteria bacterium]|nr:S-methyl-5-thioribose-1-phosphate isomerase [Gammaproteobacteria bacterium]
MYDTIRPVIWKDGALQLLDQRLLPQREEYMLYHQPEAVATAIREMVVRGAPAIGISAAYGVVLSAKRAVEQGRNHWRLQVEEDICHLAQARPTAVNLNWALAEMGRVMAEVEADSDPVSLLLQRAQQIHEDDIANNHLMGRMGAALIARGSGAVLTHCNAGALATGGYGTALGVIRSAYAEQRIERVFADETRPWLQGARLTAWELVHDRIPVTLIAEGAAARLMQQGEVSWVVVGSDRIAANGDVANKIGTCGVAILARHYGVKMMVVAPTSTVDMALTSGDEIPIEERSGEELLNSFGTRVAAKGCQAWNPVFDITPASLVDVIVTERGVVEAPNAEKMAAMMASN